MNNVLVVLAMTLLALLGVLVFIRGDCTMFYGKEPSECIVWHGVMNIEKVLDAMI